MFETLGLFIFCAVSTIAGCWAIDHITGAADALRRSKQWEKGGRSNKIEEKENTNHEIQD